MMRYVCLLMSVMFGICAESMAALAKPAQGPWVVHIDPQSGLFKGQDAEQNTKIVWVIQDNDSIGRCIRKVEIVQTNAEGPYLISADFPQATRQLIEDGNPGWLVTKVGRTCDESSYRMVLHVLAQRGIRSAMNTEELKAAEKTSFVSAVSPTRLQEDIYATAEEKFKMMYQNFSYDKAGRRLTLQALEHMMYWRDVVNSAKKSAHQGEQEPYRAENQLYGVAVMSEVKDWEEAGGKVVFVKSDMPKAQGRS